MRRGQCDIVEMVFRARCAAEYPNIRTIRTSNVEGKRSGSVVVGGSCDPDTVEGNGKSSEHFTIRRFQFHVDILRFRAIAYSVFPECLRREITLQLRVLKSLRPAAFEPAACLYGVRPSAAKLERTTGK